MKIEEDYKNVDIWHEAIQIPEEIYQKERELLELHLKRMESSFQSRHDIASVFEAWEAQPHRFFLFKINNQVYCGQKLLSPIVSVHKSPGFFCSLIKPEMILGEFIQSQTSQQGVEIFYQEISVQQRLDIFENLKNDRMIDIWYPFVHLSKEHRLEINTPANGWFITQERAELLAIGEKHLRKKSAELLQADNLKNPILYDPACSTGKFLEEMKQVIPDAFAIGQDLSEQMCQWAAPKLDRVIVGNSIEPGVENKSCDYIFFRFLNAEVVPTRQAKILFERIIKCLKEDGKAILFGHTPVLITIATLKQMNFHIEQCNEFLPEENAVFQYYVIKHK